MVKRTLLVTRTQTQKASRDGRRRWECERKVGGTQGGGIVAPRPSCTWPSPLSSPSLSVLRATPSHGAERCYRTGLDVEQAQRANREEGRWFWKLTLALTLASSLRWTETQQAPSSSTHKWPIVRHPRHEKRPPRSRHGTRPSNTPTLQPS